MRNRVLMCAVLALAVTAPNAPAQVITNMVKRAGVGGSVGGIFTSDDDVNTGWRSESTPAWRRHPGSARRLAWGGIRRISRCPGCPATEKSDVFAFVRSWPASVTPG